MNIKSKVFLSILFISLLIMLSVTYIYSLLGYEKKLFYEKEHLTRDASDIAMHVEKELLGNLSNVLTIGSAPILFKTLTQSNKAYASLSDRARYIKKMNRLWMNVDSPHSTFIYPYLNNALAMYLKQQQIVLKDVYGEIFITNKYGALVAATDKLTTFAHAQKYWWQEAYNKGKGKIFFDDRGYDMSACEYVIGVTVPIRNHNEVIGILKANIRIMTLLKDTVQTYDKLNRGSLKVVRTGGLVVYEQGLPPLSTKVNPQILNHLKKRKTGSVIVKDYGKEKIIAYAPVKLVFNNKKLTFGGKVLSKDHEKGNSGEIWHTVISYDKKLALAESIRANKNIVLLGVLLSILAIVSALLLLKWISKSVEALQKAHQKIQEQDEIMVAQSRHAAMGEMISMIAHQWRQPISVIAMDANNILADIELEMIDEKTLQKTSLSIINKTQELSKTIDDFRNFFKSEKEVSEVLAQDILQNALNIIDASFKNHNIELILDIQSSLSIKTYSRELMQVFLNILQNAKDALVENKIEKKKIYIIIEESFSSVTIKICDNAHGIKTELLQKIFNPYFSTKSEKNGTGLGLYMSKTIVEQHLLGSIKAYNKEDGACFEIQLPHAIKGAKNEAL